MVPSRVYWTPRTTDFKTGNVPMAYVGATRAESLRSCEGCPLLDSHNCYAQFGVPAMGHANVIRSAQRTGRVYDFESALRRRHRDARMVRIAALGEPGRMPLAWWDGIRARSRAEGLAVVAYIHNWAERHDLAGHAMASCDSMGEVDVALGLGFRATVVLPRTHEGRTFTTDRGAKGVVCPAQLAPGLVDCNRCRRCDASVPGPVIGFIDHGPRGNQPGVRNDEVRERLLEWMGDRVVTLREARDALRLATIRARFLVRDLVTEGRLEDMGRSSANGNPRLYRRAA